MTRNGGLVAAVTVILVVSAVAVPGLAAGDVGDDTAAPAAGENV